MAVATLDAMADGGIHDQLGGGFHRYAVDGRWLVPHFEKMLYDNALLARAYAIARVRDRRRRATRAVARDVSTTSTARCSSTSGGVASAPGRRHRGRRGPDLRLDAGRASRAALGDDALAAAVCDWYGITGPGNFEGTNVLSVVGTRTRRRPGSTRRARRCSPRASRDRSRAATTRRWRPGTAWRCAAFADAGRLLGEPGLRRARA